MSKPSKMLGKGPDVPSGGRMNPKQENKTMPKVKLPKKGSTTYAERSTRDAGPK
jgi:hypothetical protein